MNLAAVLFTALAALQPTEPHMKPTTRLWYIPIWVTLALVALSLVIVVTLAALDARRNR